MNAVNDGGPAFPILERGGQGLELSCVGMSLRDHFAGLAMAAIISNTTWFDKITEVQAMRLDLPSEPDALGQAVKHMVAVHAVEFADAMLKAREQKGGAA